MKPRLALYTLAAALMLLAAPASALADDFCVGSPPGCTGTDEGTDLQAALDAAKNHVGSDRVLIGPGTYTQLNGFVYVDGVPANTVDIIGVGSPQPIITMTANAGQNHALTLQQTGSTVSNLTFDVPSTAFSLFGLFVGGATAHDVTVTGPATNSALNTGVQAINGTLRDSTINAGLGGSGSVGVDARNNSVVEDNTIFGIRGLDMVGNVQATRNRISARFVGVFVQSGNPQIDNTLIDMRGGTGGTTQGLEVTTIPAGLTPVVEARQLTIRNGDSQTIGVDELTFNANSIITVNLTDSIIRDVGVATRLAAPPAASSLTLNADHDDYDSSTDLPVTTVAGQSRNETNLINLDPVFLNPVLGIDGITGDYRVAFNSPVIDAGSSTALGTGEFDIRGLPRIVDGNAPFLGASRDLGAYEYQLAAPVAQSSASPGAASTGQAVTFSSAGSSDVDGDALTYAWSFDDGGSATGASPTHAFASAGTHTATLTATDPTGLTGSAMATVAVSTPPATATGQQAAALKKCKKIKNKAKRRKCKKRAKRLPL